MVSTDPGISNSGTVPEKAPSAMPFTVEGMAYDPLASGYLTSSVPSLSKRTPSTEENATFPDSTFMDLRNEQPENTPSPMETTAAGTVKDESEEHPAKALSPMETAEGMLTDISEEQPLNRPSLMAAT